MSPRPGQELEVREKRAGMGQGRGLESGIKTVGVELTLWRCGVSDLGQSAQRRIPPSREASPPGTRGIARAEQRVWPAAPPARVLGNFSMTPYPGRSTQNAPVRMLESPHKAVFSGCQVTQRIWESLKKSGGKRSLGARPPHLKPHSQLPSFNRPALTWALIGRG